ncbi:MAG TPA: ABC transporter permease [Humisphaera sp.]|nr:ABC transporter permease [Humisphaera sp.]
MAPDLSGANAYERDALAPEAARSLASDAWQRIVHSKLSMLCLIIVVIYFLVGLASLLPVFGRKINEPLNDGAPYQEPRLFEQRADGSKHLLSPAHWLGTEFQGRSVFWRVLYGSRIALLITVCASAMSLGIGTVLGVISGYFGGWVDDLITWLYSTISSVPWLLLVIAMAYAIQGRTTAGEGHPWLRLLGGTFTVILSLGLTDWVSLCRLMRGEVLKLRDRDFVSAARAMGLGHWRILFRHILPNTTHLIIITFSLGAVSYVQVEVVLAFLGLGITDKPSWGKMIDDAKLELLRGVWWQVTAATVAIFVLCLALNILGDALRDALDPKLRGVD